MAWNHFSHVLNAVHETLSNKQWSWIKNARCKYVSIKIDMRDGKAILLDRNGKRIEHADLFYQYAKK